MTLARPQARCGLGLLEGLALPAADDRPHPVHAFLGIPYAQAPVGDLRWRAPQPATGWDGVRTATAFGPDSPQAPDPALRGAGHSEDCLHLNVWAPADAAPGSLPVMVWVHGGGFAGGAGSDVNCDGAALAAQGVVVVTFNYRVGLFGFLAHPDLRAESEHGVAGNYGLLDQLMALRWVQAHIAAFGGDARRVTAFGYSAGSASLSLLLTSPLSRGLFSQCILQSPGAGRPLADLPTALAAGAQLGADIEALRQLPSAEVFARTGLLQPKVRGLTTPRVLRPILDGWVVPGDERAALQAGRLQPMPLLVGSNFDEGSLLTKAWPVKTRDDWREMAQANFGAMAQEAMALYPADDDTEARPAVAAMFADTQFNYGTRLLARAMAATGQPTWRYLFTRRRAGQADGPHHGDEVAYVFGNRPDDALVCHTMRDAWLRFARTGHPGGGVLPAWPPAGADADPAMVFGDLPAPGSRWRQPQLDFLERFFQQREASGR